MAESPVESARGSSIIPFSTLQLRLRADWPSDSWRSCSGFTSGLICERCSPRPALAISQITSVGPSHSCPSYRRALICGLLALLIASPPFRAIGSFTSHGYWNRLLVAKCGFALSIFISDDLVLFLHPIQRGVDCRHWITEFLEVESSVCKSRLNLHWG